jgi:hypothetical protein
VDGTKVREVAEAQRGLVSRSQLVALELTEVDIARWLRRGTIVELLPSVYRLGDVPETWELFVDGALMWAGPEAIHVATSKRLTPPKAPRIPVRVHITNALGRWDRDVFDGVRTTSAERTILDLADRMTEAQLMDVIDDAFRKRRTEPHRINACYRRLKGKGRKGVAMLGRIFVRRGPTLVRTGSPLERKFLDLCQKVKLPLPQAQVGLPLFGTPDVLIDFGYPELQLGIEIDSQQIHFGNEDVWEEDRLRWNQIVGWGWRVLTFTARQLKSPEYVRETVLRAFRMVERTKPCGPGQCKRFGPIPDRP